MEFMKLPLIALATIALGVALGCAGRSKVQDPEALQAQAAQAHADYRQLIASVIDDPARAASFAALADERDSLIRRHSASVQRYSMAMSALNANYSATREDFEKLIRTYNSARHVAQIEAVALLGRMKATTTQKEWKTLAKFELDNLKPRATVYSTGST